MKVWLWGGAPWQKRTPSFFPDPGVPGAEQTPPARAAAAAAAEVLRLMGGTAREAEEGGSLARKGQGYLGSEPSVAVPAVPAVRWHRSWSCPDGLERL